MIRLIGAALAALCFAGAQAAANPAGVDWVAIGAFDIARTETTVGQFRRFVEATGTVTRAERDGGGNAKRLTRGGSWWYGAAQMRADHLQGKPGDTTVAYIGFRCARER